MITPSVKTSFGKNPKLTFDLEPHYPGSSAQRTLTSLKQPKQRSADPPYVTPTYSQPISRITRPAAARPVRPNQPPGTIRTMVFSCAFTRLPEQSPADARPIIPIAGPLPDGFHLCTRYQPAGMTRAGLSCCLRVAPTQRPPHFHTYARRKAARNGSQSPDARLRLFVPRAPVATQPPSQGHCHR